MMMAQFIIFYNNGKHPSPAFIIIFLLDMAEQILSVTLVVDGVDDPV